MAEAFVGEEGQSGASVKVTAVLLLSKVYNLNLRQRKKAEC